MRNLEISVLSRMFVVILLFIMISCSERSSSDELLLLSKSKCDSPQWIALVTETGCSSCNIMFSELVSTHVNDSNGVIVISASGQILDMLPYYSEKATNVIGADRQLLLDKNINSISQFLYLGEDNKIDSTVEIEAQKLEKQLGDIRNYMEQCNK